MIKSSFVLLVPSDSEFCCLASKNLQAEFFKELNKYTPQFIECFKSRGGRVGKNVMEYLQQITPVSFLSKVITFM